MSLTLNAPQKLFPLEVNSDNRFEEIAQVAHHGQVAQVAQVINAEPQIRMVKDEDISDVTIRLQMNK